MQVYLTIKPVIPSQNKMKIDCFPHNHIALHYAITFNSSLVTSHYYHYLIQDSC